MSSLATYNDFIKEAFIDPIRSVLIIDDDYPTFDEVLANQTHENLPAESRNPSYRKPNKDWYNAPIKIEKVISQFRKKSMLIDIDDGSYYSEPEGKNAIQHLHQSDLLVLDYQLNGPNGDGTTAIKVLRSIMENDHFNLVVVHSTKPPEETFSEVLISLLNIPETKQKERIELGENLVFEEEDNTPNIIEHLRETINESQYFASRKKNVDIVRSAHAGEEPFSNFREKCRDFGWTGPQINNVLCYLLRDFENQHKDKFNNEELTNLTWSSFENDVFWIRSNTAFITFTQKNEDLDILSALLKGLETWNPKPSRLFLTKIRSEIEAYGSSAEDEALGDNHVLARWYLELLSSEEGKRKHAITESISRHSEQLLSAIKPRAEKFGNKLIDSEIKNKSDIYKAIKEHFHIDLLQEKEKDLSELKHNIFIGSQKPEGWHLTTGHIFYADNDYWICLSPACDLVPDQKTGGMYGEVGNNIPFTAVKLRSMAPKEVQKIPDIHSNRYIFTNINDDPHVFCINDPYKQDSSPHWYTLFAEKHGIFENNMQFKVAKLKQGIRALKFNKHSAQVVAQLRYEYALNHMQRLGINLTRIGLDFSGRKKDKSSQE